MSTHLYDLTIHEARELLDAKRVSSQELTQSVLARVDEVESQIKAFVTISPDTALREAKEADYVIAHGETSSLTGIPMQLKDNICTRGVPTTCSSKMLASFVPPYDATAVSYTHLTLPTKA